jgi:hypothetical protein
VPYLAITSPSTACRFGVLAAGLEIGVPESLKGAGEQGALTIEAGRLAQMLVSRYGHQEYIARWAIAAWAFALGYWDEQHVSSTLTVAEPSPEPKRAVDDTRAGEMVAATPTPPVGGGSGHGGATASPSDHAREQPPPEPAAPRPGGQLLSTC